MFKRSIWSLVAGALSLVLLGAACDSGDDNGGNGALGGTDTTEADGSGDDDDGDAGDDGEDGAAASSVDACELLSADDVEEVTGTAVEQQGDAATGSCSYAPDPETNPGEFLVVTVAVTAGVGDQDLEEFARLQSGVFGGEEDAPEIEEVPGLGNAAFAFDAGIAYILVIQVGDDIINLSVTGTDSPSDAALELAEIVVANS